MDDVLHAQIDRQFHRLQRLVIGHAGGREIGKPWSSMYFSMPATPRLSILT